MKSRVPRIAIKTVPVTCRLDADLHADLEAYAVAYGAQYGETDSPRRADPHHRALSPERSGRSTPAPAGRGPTAGAHSASERGVSVLATVRTGRREGLRRRRRT